MAAYRQVYDSRHMQADCKEQGSAPEHYARQPSMRYLYLFTLFTCPPHVGEQKIIITTAHTVSGHRILFAAKARADQTAKNLAVPAP